MTMWALPPTGNESVDTLLSFAPWLAGAGFLVWKVWERIRRANEADRDRLKIKIDESTEMARLSREDAIRLAQTRADALSEAQRQVAELTTAMAASRVELEDSRRRERESSRLGAEFGHEYLKLRGEFDQFKQEFNERVELIERGGRKAKVPDR